MVIPGRVKNGVVVLEGGPPLPEGAPVTVSCDIPPIAVKDSGSRVQFPLVRSKHPGSLKLTADRVAEFLEEEDVSP